MGGGLMQLVAYGAQDIYLTGNPQITFFKVVYRRHTNFSMECIRQTPNGTGSQQSVTISRNGDLIGKINIEFTYNIHLGIHATSTSSNRKFYDYGPNEILKNVEVEIGGQLIDRQSGKFIQAYGDLTDFNPSGRVLSKYQNNVLRGGSGPNYISNATITDIYTTARPNTCCWIPLKFWFCRNPGLALPLIALQYHEVKLNVEYNDILKNSSNQVIVDSVDKTSEFQSWGDVTHDYWVDYIYLDTDERRRFAQVSHEYLIEQVQHQIQTHNLKHTSNPGKLDLVFNHPVKELIWMWTGLSNNTTNPNVEVGIGSESSKQLDIENCSYQLKLNGHDRFHEMNATYFTRLQSTRYHTGGSLNRPTVKDQVIELDRTGTHGKHYINETEDQYKNDYDTDYLNVYSFALKPEDHQPSGTCNFSRIDKANLLLNLKTNINRNMNINDTIYENELTLTVFAKNYNILKIMNGMAGVAYSN